MIEEGCVRKATVKEVPLIARCASRYLVRSGGNPLARSQRRINWQRIWSYNRKKAHRGSKNPGDRESICPDISRRVFRKNGIYCNREL